MAPRAILLTLLLVGSAVALSGCTDRLQGVGTLRVVMKLTDESSAIIAGKTYPNVLSEFSALPAPVGSVVVKRNDSEPVVKSVVAAGRFDLVQIQGGEAVLMSQKVSSGRMASVSITIPPFNATLADGRTVKVNTSLTAFPPAPYEFPKDATVETAGETTIVAVFMVTKAATTKEEFILIGRLSKSEVR